MDPFSVILLLAGVGIAGRLAFNDGHFTRNGRLAAQYRQRYEMIRRQQQQVAAMQARQFQAAILSMDSNPDFQRVAAAVRTADQVPSSFKVRQYHRFRPHFIRHYRRCLQRGANLPHLRSSLEQLVQSFQLEPFEADYLRIEAEHNLPTGQRRDAADPVEDFRSRISQIQEEHQQRVTAIRELSGVSDDIREQLLETEERRYQSRLFQNDPGNM